MAAADLLLEAIHSRAGMRATVEVSIGGSTGDGSSWCLGPRGPFTQLEYVEAMSFLVRMGMVPGENEVGRSQQANTPRQSGNRIFPT